MGFDSEQLALLQDLRDQLRDRSRLYQSGVQQIEDCLTKFRSIMATRTRSVMNEDPISSETQRFMAAKAEEDSDPLSEDSDELVGMTVAPRVHGSATPPAKRSRSSNRKHGRARSRKATSRSRSHSSKAGSGVVSSPTVDGKRLQSLPSLIEFQNITLDRLQSDSDIVETLVHRAGIAEENSFDAGRANFVWKPGGLLWVNSQLSGLRRVNSDDVGILTRTQGYHRLSLQGNTYMAREFRETLAGDVLGLLVSMSVHNRSLEVELIQKILSKLQCLETKELARAQRVYGMDRLLLRWRFVGFDGYNAFSKELLVIYQLMQASQDLFPRRCPSNNKNWIFKGWRTFTDINWMMDEMHSMIRCHDMEGLKRVMNAIECGQILVNFEVSARCVFQFWNLQLIHLEDKVCSSGARKRRWRAMVIDTSKTQDMAFKSDQREMANFLIGVGRLRILEKLSWLKEIRKWDFDVKGYMWMELNLNECVGDIHKQDFSGKPGQSTVLRFPGLGSKRDGLIGLGKSASSPLAFQSLGEVVAAAAKASRASSVAVVLAFSESVSNESKFSSASAIASGTMLGLFEDSRYKSESKKPSLNSVDIISFGTGPELEKKLKYAEDVSYGVIFGRELVNSPANVLTPAALAEEVSKLVLMYSEVMTANILNQEQCKELNMGSYLAAAAAIVSWTCTLRTRCLFTGEYLIRSGLAIGHLLGFVI